MSSPPPIESSDAALQCPVCRCLLPFDPDMAMGETHCPACHAEVRLILFPALRRQARPESDSVEAREGDATCSFFPKLRAEKVCDECGCFLSSRAAVEWGGREICLPCLHRLREVERHPDYLGRAVLHDRRALALVTWFAPLTLFTAPLALFILFRHRGKREGFVPRTRLVWWIAFLLAVFWLIAWFALIVLWISLIRSSFL